MATLTPAQRRHREIDEEDPLLTYAQIGRLLGTSERGVRRLVSERRIDYVKIGRLVRVRRSVVAAFIAANTVSALG